MNFRIAALLSVLAFIGAGCASYVTPGGPVRLADVNRGDVAAILERRPSPNFPARIALIRIQASGYSSYSASGYGGGRFCVVPTQELLTEKNLTDFAAWPAVAGVAPINRLLLPATFESLDDLRTSAAKVQADVLLVYTVDTSFQVRGRSYGPLSLISLGVAPDRDAFVTSTASAVITDVRTGFTYGLAEATAKTSGLTNVWNKRSTLDRKRVEAEQQAVALLLPQVEKTWSDIATQYSK